ncbi:MAG: hypothetical protein V4613_10120 [Bacteroidota bacterium]
MNIIKAKVITAVLLILFILSSNDALCQTKSQEYTSYKKTDTAEVNKATAIVVKFISTLLKDNNNYLHKDSNLTLTPFMSIPFTVLDSNTILQVHTKVSLPECLMQIGLIFHKYNCSQDFSCNLTNAYRDTALKEFYFFDIKINTISNKKLLLHIGVEMFDTPLLILLVTEMDRIKK